MSGSLAADSRFGCKVLLVASAVKAAVYSLVPKESSALTLTVMTSRGHLELTVGIMWHRVELSERCSSEQCLIITAERDNFED